MAKLTVHKSNKTLKYLAYRKQFIITDHLYLFNLNINLFNNNLATGGTLTGAIRDRLIYRLIFGFYRYIDIGQNGQFYRPQ